MRRTRRSGENGDRSVPQPPRAHGDGTRSARRISFTRDAITLPSPDRSGRKMARLHHRRTRTRFIFTRAITGATEAPPPLIHHVHACDRLKSSQQRSRSTLRGDGGMSRRGRGDALPRSRAPEQLRRRRMSRRHATGRFVRAKTGRRGRYHGSSVTMVRRRRRRRRRRHQRLSSRVRCWRRCRSRSQRVLISCRGRRLFSVGHLCGERWTLRSAKPQGSNGR